MNISINRSQRLFGSLAASFIAAVAIAVVTEQYWLVSIPFAVLFFYGGWQNKSIIFFLLLASLPFSFEYNFSPQLGTDIPDEPLMLLVSVIFFCYWLFSSGSSREKARVHPLLFLLALALCWTLVTVILSSFPPVSVKYLVAKCWYLGAFILAPLVVFRTRRPIIIAGATLVFSMFLVTGIIMLRHYSSDFSFAGINEAVKPFFRNHVNYSAMLVCMIPVLAGFFHLARGRKIKWLLAMMMIIFLAALFFSYARGAWLALVTGIAAYWLIKKRLLFYSYIAAVIITTGLLFWIKKDDRYLLYAHDYETTIFHKNFKEHLVSTYKLKDVSTAERFYRWIAGVRMIKDKPLAGYGPNTFYDNYKSYAIPAYKTWVSDNAEHSTVHNYFLLTAVEQGMPGLFFLVVLIGAMVYYAQHLYKRVESRAYKTVSAVAGVMLAMMIALNFLSDLIETDKIGSLFFLCLATLIAVDRNTTLEGNRKNK